MKIICLKNPLTCETKINYTYDWNPFNEELFWKQKCLEILIYFLSSYYVRGPKVVPIMSHKFDQFFFCLVQCGNFNPTSIKNVYTHLSPQFKVKWFIMTWIGDSRFELVLGSLVTSLSNLFHSVNLTEKSVNKRKLIHLMIGKKPTRFFCNIWIKKNNWRLLKFSCTLALNSNS